MCTSQERTRLCADCLVINKSNIYRIFINSIILCIYFAKGSAVSAFVIYSRLPVIYLALGLLLIFFVGFNVNVSLWSPLHANVAKYNTCTCRLLYVNWYNIKIKYVTLIWFFFFIKKRSDPIKGFHSKLSVWVVGTNTWLVTNFKDFVKQAAWRMRK